MSWPEFSILVGNFKTTSKKQTWSIYNCLSPYGANTSTI